MADRADLTQVVLDSKAKNERWCEKCQMNARKKGDDFSKNWIMDAQKFNFNLRWCDDCVILWCQRRRLKPENFSQHQIIGMRLKDLMMTVIFNGKPEQKEVAKEWIKNMGQELPKILRNYDMQEDVGKVNFLPRILDKLTKQFELRDVPRFENFNKFTPYTESVTSVAQIRAMKLIYVKEGTNKWATTTKEAEFRGTP